MPSILLTIYITPFAEKGIKEAALACAGVRGLHDLRTRYAGDRTFVEFHLEVEGLMSVARGHQIGETAEAAIRALVDGTVEVTAHLEPAGIEDDRLDARVRRPAACPLFATACTPAQPLGPCMVSTEGACAAAYRYER